METVSDEQLLENYRKGEGEAFECLIRRYERELYNFLLRFLGKSAWAEDVFQETFLQVHLSVGAFDTGRRFRPWLYTIAANKARDLLRKQARRPTVQLTAAADSDNDDASLWDSLLRDEDTPDRIMDRHQQRDKVREIVAEMPEAYREILILAYFKQLAYKEMAEVLGIPLGTVKSRLHSAVASFAQRYRREVEESLVED